MKDFDVLLTCDVEPDFEYLPERQKTCTLSGVERAMPEYLEHSKALESETGRFFPHVFFVRCDDQMGESFGSPASLLQKYSATFAELEKRGHCIGFHPHLVAKNGSSWKIGTDVAQMRGHLARSGEAFGNAGFRPLVSRMGEGYAAPEIFSALSALGVRCDMTALPGYFAERDGARIDWRAVEEKPYRAAPDLVEIPFTMAEIRAPYDKAPRKRYVNLAYKPAYFREMLTDGLARAGHCVVVFHFHELVPGGFRHELLSYSVGDALRNLKELLGFLTLAGLRPDVVTPDAFMKKRPTIP